MNLQRNASSAGAFLILVLGTWVSAVAAGVLAATSQSVAFALVTRSLLISALVASALAAFMKWGLGGSLVRWLGVALAAYVVTPSSWSANTFFLQGVGVPAGVAWVGDAMIWMAVAWWTASRVLPTATREEDLHRLH